MLHFSFHYIYWYFNDINIVEKKLQFESHLSKNKNYNNTCYYKIKKARISLVKPALENIRGTKHRQDS